MADCTEYTIVGGDTLGAIAKRFYGHADLYQAIADYNMIANPDRINAGDKLKLPGNLFKKKSASKNDDITTLVFDAVTISSSTSLKIRAFGHPADSRLNEDSFVLSTDDGNAKIEKKLEQVGTGDEKHWALVFDDLDPDGIYTLTAYQGPKREARTIFKNKKYGGWTT